MTYEEFLLKLKPYCDEKFAAFERKLINTPRTIIGIRTPDLRKIAKEERKNVQTLFSYPDEIYEVVFIKLSVVSLLSFEEMLPYLEKSVRLMDNWALTDQFKPKCVEKKKKEFLPYIEKLFNVGEEFYVRFALVMLLSFYVKELEYLPLIFRYLQKADTKKYYVHMAAAWLIAEILIKYKKQGIEFLLSGGTDVKTRNKALQKARESYRLTIEEKEFLNSLKIKEGK